MFIDQSYFIGPLTIAQLGQKAVSDDFNNFINQYEPVIMEAALGYDFYQAFLSGLTPGSDEQIEQRWLDLLGGIPFTNINGIKRKFVGFSNGGSNTLTIIPVQRGDLSIYAGITPGFPANGNSYNDPTLAAWDFSLEIFGLGTLDQMDEWDYITSGGIQLTSAALGDPNYRTHYGDRWIIHFNSKKVTVVPSSAVNPVSPLAGFIFYEYMKSLASQNTGIGFVKSVSENSVPANPVAKAVNAFNVAAYQIRDFWDMMQADQQLTVPVYPEFSPIQVIGYNYGYWNGWAYWFSYTGYETYSFRTKNVYGI